MTGTPFDDDMAGAEAMLRGRLEHAVGAMTPDIGRLVAAGTADGRGALRRRRLLSGVAAAAIAVIAVGSITYATQSDLLGSDDHATDNSQLIELQPATPRGLAAAVMAHTGDVGTLVAVGGTRSPGSRPTLLSAQVAYDLGAGVGLEVDAYATTDMSAGARSACDDASKNLSMALCREFALPDGTTAWYVEYASIADTGDGSPGVMSGVATARDDQVVAVFQTISGTTGVALDQAALAAIVADPAVGMSTTPDLNAVGADLPGFKDGGLLTRESVNSGSGSATAPPPRRRSLPPAREPTSGSGDASSASSN
jgi:hypothetical protein